MSPHRRHDRSQWRHERWGSRGVPPWWPEGEPWPPQGRPDWHRVRHRMPHRMRRRLKLAFGVFFLVVCGIAWLIWSAVSGWRDGHGSGGGWGGGPPFGLVGVLLFVLVVGSIASARAYRRLGRPIGKLLDAADQVAEGDFAISVAPEGPRELRSLATAFNEMAGRLAATDEQRRRFLADISHELRTPLAVLQSGIEAQLDGIHPRDDQHLASLLDETRRLGRLIGDLHTLALADAGKLVLDREPIDIGAVVEEAVAGHVALAGRAGVRLDAEVAAGLPPVDGDAARLRQVLDNLLANALRYTPSGGSVRVTASADGSDVEVVVADTGTGFPADRLDHVFERFVRAADSSGSGLGLSIARDLVEAHGGRITARNRPEGGGLVSFTLPIAR